MRTLLFLFLSSSAFAADLPFKDPDFSCVSRADGERFVRDYSIDTVSFGGFELCDNSKDTKKLFNDLSLIEKGEFGSDLRHPMAPGIIPQDNYYGWMKSETRGMERGNDIPWATAYNRGGYFTMQDGWAALSTLGRVGTVIHEARHTEGYMHYRCTHGPYGAANTPGCDTSYSQKGSHSVEMEYYTRVALDSKNLHPVYKNMARLMAMGRSNFVFNDSPIKGREALAGLAGDRIVLVDGGNSFERDVPPNTQGFELKRTSFGASMVKGKEAFGIDLYSGKSYGERINDDYSYYKLFHTDREGGPTSVQALEELDQNNLRYFVALADGGKVYSYNFAGGNWFPATQPVNSAVTMVTRAPNGASGLFVVTRDGSILPFNLSTRSFGAPMKDRWSSDTVAYAMNGNMLVKLMSNGSVVDANGNVVPAFSGRQVTNLINVPLYDAYEVAR